MKISVLFQTRRFAHSLLHAAVLVGLTVSSWLVITPSYAAPDQPAIVPCKDLGALRDLNKNLVAFTNPSTGNTLSYVVVGDAVVSNELIVFFNGTSQVLAD